MKKLLYFLLVILVPIELYIGIMYVMPFSIVKGLAPGLILPFIYFLIIGTINLPLWFAFKRLVERSLK